MAKRTTTTTTRKRIRRVDGATETRLTAFEEASASTVTATSKELVAQALQRFKLAESAENQNRSEALYDLKFSTGDQWPADIKSQRGLDGRPCLTINRINEALRQVNNDELDSRPAAQIDPVGDLGDPKVAGILQGMFRHIEIDSNAEQVYSRKFDKMLRCGFANYRVLTEFEAPDSFDQKIVIREIANDFTVYWDPMAVLPDRSDAQWCMIVEDVPTGEYKEMFGEAPVGGTQNMMSVGDQPASWISGQSIRVAEYYYFKTKEERLFKLANGKGKFASDLNGTEEFEYDEEKDKQGNVVSRKAISRMSERKQLKWCKINCEDIIEGNDDNSEGRDVPCQWIPIIPMIGEELNIDGARMLIGMVRYARDPQRIYNYWDSSLTEAIALAPKAPFIIAAGQIDGFEQYWETANKRNWPYLPYKFTTSSGQPAPAPQRMNADVNTAAIVQALAQAERDLNATLGVHRASLGDVGGEKSGRAILARQKQDDVGNANWGFNRNWSLLHCWRVVLDMMPHIYNGERAQRIIRPDNESDVALINQLFIGPDGNEELYDIANAAGKYAVTLSIGTPQSRRQQAVATMGEIIKAQPELFTMIGDLFVGQLDADGNWKQLMVERLKKMLPPQLQDQKGDIPPAVMQKMQQLMQQVQQLSQLLTEAQDQLESDAAGNQTKTYIAQLNAQKDILINTMKYDSIEGMEAARQEFKRITEQLKLHHEHHELKVDRAHELEIERIAAKAKPKSKPS